MDLVGNVISTVIGGLIGAALTYWRMRVVKAARKNDLHNAALTDVETWEGELNSFFSRCGLMEQTQDIRLLFTDFAEAKSAVTNIKSHTRSIIRRVRDI